MERLCITYAKHGNLVNADASGDKSSTKHIEKLESCLEVIQGHSFWHHWKANECLRIEHVYSQEVEYIKILKVTV